MAEINSEFAILFDLMAIFAVNQT